MKCVVVLVMCVCVCTQAHWCVAPWGEGTAYRGECRGGTEFPWARASAEVTPKVGEERKIHPPGHQTGLCAIGHIVFGGTGAWEQPGAGCWGAGPRLQEAWRAGGG